jgi:porin
MAGVADAQADSRETGFRTTFHNEDYFLYTLETGISPQLNSTNGQLQGTYRIGLWYDPQDKERFSNGETRRDDTGFYVNFDQMLCRESNDADDTQGLGVFGRYGWADSKVNEITNFFSLGLQYQGLFNDRDDDVLALGFAQGVFSNASSDFSDDYESVWELYYNAQLTPWLNISPSIQYITNPGGDSTTDDAVVFGARAQMTF